MINILRSPRVLSFLAAGGLFVSVMGMKINTPATPPLFNDLGGFALFAQEEVKLEKDVQVSSGDLGSNEKIDIEKDVVVNGNLFADKITLDKNTVINGNVSFNKLKTQKESQILGTQTKPVQLPIANLPDIPWITPGEQDFKFQGQNNTLLAGNYRNLTIEKGGKLILSGGAYHILKLELKDNSTLIFNAPTTLNVLFKLRGHDRVAILPGSNLKPDDLAINYLGLRDKKDKDAKEDDDKEINSHFDDDKERGDHKNRKIGRPVVFGQNSFLNFKLLAPKASVKLGETSTIRGQVLARKINVGKGTVVSKETTFSSEPDPTKITEDKTGNQFIANELIIVLTIDANISDAQRIADHVNGRVVGVVESINLYKIRVNSSTSEELRNFINVIISIGDPLVEIVTINNLIDLF